MPTGVLLSLAPDFCLLGGFCAMGRAASGPPSGLLFLAVGLVLLGVAGVGVGGRKNGD